MPRDQNQVEAALPPSPRKKKELIDFLTTKGHKDKNMLNELEKKKAQYDLE